MSEESSLMCANCKRDIPSFNYEMHVVHCQRNIQLCSKCEEPVPRSELSEHDLEFHSQVKCPECQKTLESSSLDDHKTNECPKRQKQCQYCELELKADTMGEHEEYCGSRTENCEGCGKLVTLKNQQMHVESGHRKIRPDEDAEDSSDDEDEGAYARRSRNNVRNARSHRNDQRRSGASPGIVHTYYPQRFDYDFDLDQSLENMELDYARNSATVHPRSPPRRNRPTQNSSGRNRPAQNPVAAAAETDLIPCEFCEAPIAFDDLVLHQTGCRPDLVYSPPRSDSRKSAGVSTRTNGALRPPILEDETLIPCEFCLKPFNLDFFAIHQSACQSRRVVPAPRRPYGHYEDDD